MEVDSIFILFYSILFLSVLYLIPIQWSRQRLVFGGCNCMTIVAILGEYSGAFYRTAT